MVNVAQKAITRQGQNLCAGDRISPRSMCDASHDANI